MKHPLPLLAVTAHALLLWACTPPPAPESAPRPQAQARPDSAEPVPQENDTIRAFRSEAEIQEFTLGLLREQEERQERARLERERVQREARERAERERRREERRWRWPWQRRPPPPPPAPPPPPPPPPAAAPPPVASAAPAGAAESVTNVQHAGVDEGGIVKVHGDYLVVLRRGRLFTIRLGGNDLRSVSAVDAFGPDIDPASAWYDEILVSGEHVVVIGYSYGRGGTELGIFRISPDGRLTHRGTYHMRSADYYSSRNYASRLIGQRLIFYAPLPVNLRDPAASFPALRRWGAADSTFRPTVQPTRVYRPAGPATIHGLTLHTVTICDLAGDDLGCRSTALYGPPGRVFYVSPSSVYVWAVAYSRNGDGPPSMLYRLPLDGSAPTGLRVTGSPVDQFSFLESGDGHLNVLTRTDAWGESMWGSEYAQGRLALLRVPLSQLGSGGRTVDAERYRPLPGLQGYGFQNRYVGEWLIYGVPAAPRTAADSARLTAYAVPWAGGEAVPVRLPHGVERIEAMGGGAVLIGGSGRDLHFTGLRLDDGARPTHSYVRPGASQSESRSHGFFYRPDGDEEGLLGLPILGPAPGGEYDRGGGSAAVLFLRNRNFRLAELGELAALPTAGDDACRASCVDWYGNARPLFLRGRILALLGYELVEGREAAGRIRELRRVNFMPLGLAAGISGDWRFAELVGAQGSRYFCDTEGTMRLDRDGTALSMRYRQRAECTTDGRTSRSDGRGSGTGTVSANALHFRVDTCEYAGRMEEPDRITGTMVCRIGMPDGSTADVEGQWQATRAR